MVYFTFVIGDYIKGKQLSVVLSRACEGMKSLFIVVNLYWSHLHLVIDPGFKKILSFLLRRRAATLLNAQLLYKVNFFYSSQRNRNNILIADIDTSRRWCLENKKIEWIIKAAAGYLKWIHCVEVLHARRLQLTWCEWQLPSQWVTPYKMYSIISLILS